MFKIIVKLNTRGRACRGGVVGASTAVRTIGRSPVDIRQACRLATYRKASRIEWTFQLVWARRTKVHETSCDGARVVRRDAHRKVVSVHERDVVKVIAAVRVVQSPFRESRGWLADTPSCLA